MQALPFLFLHLLNLIKLILIPLLYVGAVVFVGKYVLRIHREWFWTAYVPFLFLIPVVWLGNGYIAFRAGCNPYNPPNNLEKIAEVDGFYVRTFITERSGMALGNISDAPYKLVDDKVYKYVETRRSLGFYNRYDSESKSLRGKGYAFRESIYDFEITTPKAIDEYREPYHKISHIRIVSAQTGEVVAAITESLYGGGLLGQYLRYLGDWSQDSEYLACGYAGGQPHYFRPRGGEKDKSDIKRRYLEADIRFITSILPPIGRN